MRTITSLAVGLALLLSASPALASSSQDAQIAALLAQIQLLQAQLAQLSGGSSSSSSCVDLRYNLYADQSDAKTNGEVSKLQRFLGTTVSGYFGPTTETAVQRWQSSHGIVSSGSPDSTGYGYVGPKTRAAMACSNSGIYVPNPGTTPGTNTDTSNGRPVTITYPNGGENLTVGLGKDVDMRVKWSTTASSGTAYLYLRSADGGMCYLGSTSITSRDFPVSFGQSVTCPNTNSSIVAGQYQIVLNTSLAQSSSGVRTNDESDGYFTLSVSGNNASATLLNSITPSRAAAGDSVTLRGTNLGNASSIQFYDSRGYSVAAITIPSSTVTSVSSDRIVFTVTDTFAYNVGAGTYLVKVVTPNGTTNTASFTLTTSATDTSQPVVSISASPSSISGGSSSTITWNSSNTTYCISTGSDLGTPTTLLTPSGSATVSPTKSAVYSVSCTNGASTVTKSVTVNVNETSLTPNITSTGAKAAGNFEADAGGELTIYGTNLLGGTDTSYGTHVSIGYRDAVVTSASPSVITIKVPTSLSAGGYYDMYLYNSSSSSNHVTIHILSALNVPISAPVISSVNGKGGFGTGDSNTIYGKYFTTTQSVYLKNFEGITTSLSYSLADDGTLNVSIPTMEGGNYLLYVRNSVGTSGGYNVGWLGPQPDFMPIQ